MRRRRLLRGLVFAPLALFSFYLSAQDVFVLPSLTGSTSPTVFTADPFSQAAVINSAASNTSFAFAGPSGKIYLVSNTNTGTVQVTDSSFANLRTIINLSGAIYATITDDGKYLLVEAGGGLLTIIKTANDSVVNTNLFLSGTLIDLAVSIDSTQAFGLISSSAGLKVAVVNLSSGTLAASYAVPGLNGSGISVAPSGLVYVSTQNAVLELDPNTFEVRYNIPATGRPGRVYYTPDGKTGVAANETPVNGTEAFVINLVNRTLTTTIPQSSFPGNVTLDQIIPVNDNRAIAYSSAAQSLYDMTLNPPSVVPFSFSKAGSVSAVAASNSVPTANDPNTQFLFFTSNSTAYRVDLNAGQITGQQALTGTAGYLSFSSPGTSGEPAAAVFTFGDNQSVAPNAESALLVVKVVDSQGRPISGVAVTFSTTSKGVTFSNASSLTDNAGNASTSVKVTITGVVTVNVTAGALTTSFTVNVGSSGAGGPTGGLEIEAGQGQVLPASGNATPLEVLLTDQTGAPLQGQAVVFTLQNGGGTISDGFGHKASVGGTVTVTTTSCNSKSGTSCTPGLAQIDFSASGLSAYPGFQTQMITASAPGSVQTFFVTSTAGSLGYDPTTLNLTTQPTNLPTLQAGQTLTGAITGFTAYGSNALQYISLSIVNGDDPTQPAPAYCAGQYAPFAMSNAKGIVSCDLTVPATEAPGTYRFSVNLGYNRTFGTYTLTVVAPSPTNVSAISGDKQTGAPGQQLSQPLVVQVVDAGGNPSAGVAVTWTVTPSSAATVSPTTSTTNSSGYASTTVTLGSSTGTVQVEAKTGSLPAVTFNLTATVPVAGVQLVSGGGQSAPLNATFSAPIVFKVVSASGQSVPGATVTFSVTNGATLGNTTATSDSNGFASTTVTAGGTAGTITVTAQSGSYAASATLTAGAATAPSNIVFLNGAGFTMNISPGAIVAIQGNGLTPGIQGVLAPSGALPTTFQGVTVTFNGTAAPIFSVSNLNGVQQVVVQAPFELTGSSSATVNITGAGGGSATISNVAIQPYAPGIFETTVFGTKQAVATHADGSYVNPSNPAHPGENITLYVAGLGQTNPAMGTNQAGVAGENVVAKVVAGVNNAGVPVVSAQAAPGLVGVYLVTMTIPSNEAGGTLPVQAIAYDSAGNPYFAQGSVLPIQ